MEVVPWSTRRLRHWRGFPSWRLITRRESVCQGTTRGTGEKMDPGMTLVEVGRIPKYDVLMNPDIEEAQDSAGSGR